MFSENYEENRRLLKEALRSDQCFDIIERKITLQQKQAVMFYIDGFVKDDTMEHIMEYFYQNTSDDIAKDARTFASYCVPYVEVDVMGDINMVVKNVLSGVSCIMVDGFRECVMLDMRTYPQRSTSEPQDDKVLRGSKDGFVETLIFNCALIRRRIRDPKFTTTVLSAGKSSQTDIVLCYMDDKVDKTLLNTLKKKIENLDIESLSMNQQSLIEALYPKKWYNPFPKVKYTERPDVAAAVCLKGSIVILVDNSPSALLLPTSIFEVLEEADDYYFPPITGTYIRIARYLITFVSVLLTPLWLLAVQNPDAVPEVFQFVIPDMQNVNISIFWQLILIEIGIDGLRLAALNTPDSLSASLSIIGALAFSEFAIDSGWFSMEVILYMAFVTIANYSQPSYELGYSLKFMRVILLILTRIFNFWGFAGGILLNIVLLFTNKTLSGKSYMYPLFPLHPKELLYKLTRIRPSSNKTT
ncbi:MAG: spore germination protein [Ruminococcaceae bacterium]|nr:spore germination protein [Oscillospiraceae bacterium]